MQMDNISFWGLFLTFSGIALIIRVVFDFEFPLLRILAGLFFILLGVKIILGPGGIWPFKQADNEIIFTRQKIDVTGDLPERFKLAFARATFDLDEMQYPEKVTDMKIDNIFSGCTVYLSREVPVRLRVDAVFAGVKMPGRNTPVFGRGSYESDDLDPGKPHINIRVNAVFGNVTFMYGQ
jgi:predicted membrane protein